MAYLHPSDRETPGFIVRLHARLSERWAVSPLHVNDRYDHWEHNDLGIAPVETIASLTVRFGEYVSVTVETRYVWPEGAPKQIEVTAWLKRTWEPRWFAVVDSEVRRSLERCGFKKFGDWRASWPANESSVDPIVAQVAGLHSIPLRILREADIPADLRKGLNVVGSEIASTDRISFMEETTYNERRAYHVVFHMGSEEVPIIAVDDTLALLRWWETQDHTQVGVPAYASDERPRADALTYEQGSAHAPDSPWGLERIRLTRAGELRYERINRGTTSEIQGRVDPARVEALLAALSKTTFPEPPQRSFPPGASVCRISLDTSPPAWVDVEFYTGLHLPGYSDVLRALSGLSAGLREGNPQKFEGWAFVRSPDQ